MKFFTRIGLLLICFLFFQNEGASQCECITFSPNRFFEMSDFVFVGTAKKVEEEKEAYKYQVQVEEIFRGVEDTATVDVFNIANSCSKGPVVGRKSLIFTRKDKATGAYTIIGCSRSDYFENKERAVIEYFRWRKNTNSKGGVLLGSVIQSNKFIREEPRKPSGVDKVFVEGSDGEKYEATIEEDGFYKLTGLKSGRYKVFLTLPDGLIAARFRRVYYGIDENDGSFEIVDSKESDNVFVFFQVTYNGVISGKVLDSDGSPVKSIKVTLSRLPNESEGEIVGEDHKTETDNLGRYDFKGLLSGRYSIKVGINDNYLDPKSIEAAYPITYFPNTRKGEKAKIIELGIAQVMNEQNITLLPKLKKRQITGQVTMKDGRPASNVNISVRAKREDDKYKSSSGWYVLAETDSQGNFSFEGYEETEYLIRAEIWKRIDDVRVEVTFSSMCFYLPKIGNIEPIKLVLKRGSNNCDEDRIKDW
jgi:5-hydroxyisourate hydrolase-like protein (transthyretin family)